MVNIVNFIFLTLKKRKSIKTFVQPKQTLRITISYGRWEINTENLDRQGLFNVANTESFTSRVNYSSTSIFLNMLPIDRIDAIIWEFTVFYPR